MCGFTGIFSLAKGYESKNLSFMPQNTLVHRGPDDDRLYSDNNIVLHFNRLAIIDLSESGNQPMCNETKDIWLVCNGEIYNYLELKQELTAKGHQFISKSDSEVILHLYEEYGIDSLSKLNGMWSFILYDKIQNKLFCSRDRFGIKPFYYFTDGEKIICASEIKAILKNGVNAESNEGKVFEYLAYAHLDVSHETMFKNIFQLLPAHYLLVEEGKITVGKYWKLPNEPNDYDYYVSDSEIKEQFRDLFFNVVKSHLRSDVPIGALLSGGLDSSAIVSVINRLNKNGEIPVDIRSFTAAYPEKHLDESEYAKSVVSGNGIQNILVYPNSNRTIINDIDKLLYHQDEPPISMTCFPHWYLMERIKEYGIKVIISGQGSDEMLAGYLEKSAGYNLLDLLLFRRYYDFLSEINLLKKKSEISIFESLLQLIKAITGRRSGMIVKSLLKDRGILFLRQEFIRKNWKVYDYKEVMDKYSRLNESLYRMLSRDSLPCILHYEDRNSMAFSIEQRVPFLDHRLAEFIFSLSNGQKIDKGISKVILRDSLSGILPELVQHRYTKLGFSVPVNRWINEMGDYISQIFNSKRFSQRPYWNSQKIIELLRRQSEKKVFMGHFLWRVLACENWHRIFIDN